jgi:hypothetical protein
MKADREIMPGNKSVFKNGLIFLRGMKGLEGSCCVS